MDGDCYAMSFCYRPTFRGFSHCPLDVRRQLQKPTLVYATIASGYISPEISCRMQDNYISTGIYRCSILDIGMKFCENFETSRISADKRFQLCLHPARFALTGPLRDGLRGKINNSL